MEKAIGTWVSPRGSVVYAVPTPKDRDDFLAWGAVAAFSMLHDPNDEIQIGDECRTINAGPDVAIIGRDEHLIVWAADGGVQVLSTRVLNEAFTRVD